MEKESKAERFLKGLNAHSVIFDLSISPEYSERQLILFAEMYHKQAQKDFLTWYTTGNNKHYSGDKLIEKYKKEVLNQ